MVSILLSLHQHFPTLAWHVLDFTFSQGDSLTIWIVLQLFSNLKIVKVQIYPKQ